MGISVLVSIVYPYLQNGKKQEIAKLSDKRNWQLWQYYAIKLQKAKISLVHLKSPEPFAVNGSNSFTIIVFDVKKSLVPRDSDLLPLRCFTRLVLAQTEKIPNS